MINNNDIDIKSIIALSGPHALQFGGAQQLRIVMARRAPEGGTGHMAAQLGSRSPVTSSGSFPSASSAPASNTPVPTQGQHGSALPDLARGPAHAPRFGDASSLLDTGFSY